MNLVRPKHAQIMVCFCLVSTPLPRNLQWWCSRGMWSQIMHPAAPLSSALLILHTTLLRTILFMVLQKTNPSLQCTPNLHNPLRIYEQTRFEELQLPTKYFLPYLSLGLTGPVLDHFQIGSDQRYPCM